jgi:DNA-binding MarR family transcriptional regulator
MARTPNRRPVAVNYEALAEFRHLIRRFVRVRELTARACGVEPQHYQLLLQVKAFSGGQRATIKALAERLQLRHHSVVELVDRLADRDMLRRVRNRADRRQVLVELRPLGDRVLRRLAVESMTELRNEGPELVHALTTLISRARRPSRALRTVHGRSQRAGPARRPARHVSSRPGSAPRRSDRRPSPPGGARLPHWSRATARLGGRAGQRAAAG